MGHQQYVLKRHIWLKLYSLVLLGHPIADAHPGNLDDIIFPGQDFNNARVFDFEGVDNWDHNQRKTKNSHAMYNSTAHRVLS